jgi:hypothetical protein
VGKSHPVIELNGNRYDANSGKILNSTNNQILHQAMGGTHVDGFGKPKAHTRSHPAPQHGSHRKPQRSQTLMRHSVKKPRSSSIHPAADTAKQVSTLHNISEKERLKRAGGIPKSPQISKFGSGTEVVKKLNQVLHVKEPPAQVDMVPPVSVNTHAITNPFHKALQEATAHTQPRLKKHSLRVRTAKRLRVSPKMLNFGAGVLAFLLLGGFFAYQNVPNLSMRVAAARAGVHAALPGYQPSGFSMNGPIQAHPGQVTLSYHSNSDERQFTINQRTSSWNNEALLENYVAVNKHPYQTFEAENKIIYIYDQSNATWVDKGVWYQVEGNSSLNSDQLLRLARSL